MKERSKEILFAHHLAFSELGARPEARAEFAAHPVTRDEALASAAADLAEQITQAIRNAYCLIVARGHGEGPDRNDKPARRLFDLLCQAEEALIEEPAAARTASTTTPSRRKVD